MTRWNNIWRWGPLYLLAVSVAASVSVSNIAVGLILVAAAVVAFREGRAANWPPRSVLLTLGSLIGSYFLATLLADPYPQNWGKFVEELWIKLLLVAVPLTAGNHPRQLERILKITLVLGGVAAVYAVVQHFLGVDLIRGRSIYRPQFGHHAVSGFFSHHLSFAGQALIFLIMTSAWYLDRPTFRRSLWLIPILATMAAALIWSFARSAQIGTLAGLMILVLAQRGRRRWWGLAGVCLSLVLVMAIAPVRAHFLQAFQVERHLTRLNLWQSSWDGMWANPLLGFGPGNFESLLAGHQVPGHYETLGHAHCDLLMHGVNGGLPAVLAAIALLVATCLVFWRAGHSRVSLGWVFFGALAVQVGITVAGFFQVYQTDDEVEILLYFVLGCALALAGAQDRPSDHVEPDI